MSEAPYHGFSTFLKAGRGYKDTKIGVMGIPFDGGSSYRTGSRFGPRAIREASTMLTDGIHPDFAVNPVKYIADYGDINVVGDTDRALRQISDGVADLAWNKPMMFMGGDHTVTYGILRPLAPYHKLNILHFDAHPDCSKNHYGEGKGHGTWLRNLIEEELIDPRRVISIGVRAPVQADSHNYLSERGGVSISSMDCMRIGPVYIAKMIRELITGPFYMSFDIDSLDPAFAPGTGTPEFGGLTPYFALEVLHQINSLFNKQQFVGMDLVEVNPAYDHSNITSLAAATIMWNVACMYIRNTQ